MKDTPKPTHVYVARDVCGCVIGAAIDLRDKLTGEHVAEFIADGLTVDRVDYETYRKVVCKEETYMSCPHGQLEMPF